MSNKRFLSPILAISLWLTTMTLLQAQQSNRMQQDLEVMQRALNQMFGVSTSSISRSDNQPRYTEGYGIVLNVPARSGFIISTARAAATSSSSSFSYSFSTDEKDEDEADSVEEADSYESSETDIMVDKMREFIKNYGDLATELPANEKIMLIYESNVRIGTASVIPSGQGIFLNQGNGTYFLNRDPDSRVKVYGTGYNTEIAELQREITRLKRELERLEDSDDLEKSLKKNKRELNTHREEIEKYRSKLSQRIAEGSIATAYSAFGNAWSQNGSYVKISAEVDMQSLLDFRERKIDESQLYDRIDIEIKNEEEKENVVYKVFADILQERVPELGRGFRQRVKFRYDQVEKYGIIYKGSLSVNGASVLYLSDGDVSEEETEDYQEYLIKWYQELIPAVTETMVSYGRTLRDLDDSEFLVVEIKIPGCKECDLPGKVTLQVKKSVLNNYDTRKISLENAVAQISIENSGSAKDNSTRGLRFLQGDEFPEPVEGWRRKDKK